MYSLFSLFYSICSLRWFSFVLRSCRWCNGRRLSGEGSDLFLICGAPFILYSAAILPAACSDPKGIDDACKRLLKEKACTYYRCASVYELGVIDEERVKQREREREGKREAWVSSVLQLCVCDFLLRQAVAGGDFFSVVPNHDLL